GARPRAGAAAADYARRVPQLRVALAQVDHTVGDLGGNAAQVLAWSRRAADAGAQLVAFPEMALTGYPAEDLVLRRAFVDASRTTLSELAARLATDGLGELAVVVGFLDRCADATPRLGRPAGEPQNAAALLRSGHIVATYAKHHLPNYGVFDEFRYFVPGDRLPVLRLHGVDVALTICEDLWQDGGPVVVARQAGVGLVVCLNASPYERAKVDDRLDLCRRRAAQAGAALAYVNLVGGQDELVFDGDSLVVDADGTLLGRAGQFAEELLVVDLELTNATGTHIGPTDAADGTTMTVERVDAGGRPRVEAVPGPAGTAHRSAPRIAPRLAEEAEVWAALVLGTRDYVRKNAFRDVVLGLSGGIDSAVTATIARDALGSAAVHVLAMPSRWSSEHALRDAKELAHRQELALHVVPIHEIVAAFDKELDVTDLAAENLQARVRGTTLMAWSNAHGQLVLTTGNKSELATGFTTLYGDSAGGFAPIKDVPKTLVWRLARWRNATARDLGETEPIPDSSITKPPSAELAPGQLDADRLPPYDVLDAVLDGYVELDRDRDELVADGFAAELVDRVIRLVDAAEYKRRQYPPGPKISPRNFGRDRRLPITSRWSHHGRSNAPLPATTNPD
ncbi:MAG TPA: NAD+ synthase, partial [Mycobacteriales bacterium]|nr:NAD+ synthase [Mycobacteriales bacterium]